MRIHRNYERLIKAIETRSVGPEDVRFNMTRWLKQESCGTSACILGFVALLEAPHETTALAIRDLDAVFTREADVKDTEMWAKGMAFLGLDPDGARDLFIHDQLEMSKPGAAVQVLKNLQTCFADEDRTLGVQDVLAAKQKVFPL